jgi:tetratricopeptide (TPR) repeat protein
MELRSLTPVFDGPDGASVNLREHARASWQMISGRRDRAMDTYRRILAADPTDQAALPMVLSDLRREGEAEQVVALAERALAVMPDAFFALDALARARIDRGEYAEARAEIIRALRSLETLSPGRPFGASARVVLGLVRIIGCIPGLRSRVPRVPKAGTIEDSASRGLAEWRKWANDHLAWYENEHGSKT